MQLDNLELLRAVQNTLKVSFAQNQEDVYLMRLFPKSRGFYVDIGAGHPVFHSVTNAFYHQGWTGINVEPHPRFFRLLSKLRPKDINLQLVISDTAGDVEFFDDTQNPERSTANIAEAERLRIGAGDCLEPFTCRSMRLSEVLESYCAGRAIDFIKIDTEGSEKVVLASGDWMRYRPVALLVESTRPGTRIPSHDEWEPILISAGYLFAWFDGVNRYYIRSEDQCLIERLREPVCHFDGVVVPYWVIRLVEAVAQAVSADNVAATASVRSDVVSLLNDVKHSPGKLAESLARYPSTMPMFIRAVFDGELLEESTVELNAPK